MAIDPGWSGLIGVLLGGLLTGGVTYFTAKHAERTRAKSLSLAVAGEAASVAAIIRFRDYQGDIRSLVASAACGDVLRLSLQLPDSTVPVARAAQQEAGALPGKLPLLVPRLALLADAFSSDIKRLDTYELEDPKSLLEEGNPEQAAAFYAVLDTLLTMILDTCDQIVAEARSLYPHAAAFNPENLDFSLALEERTNIQGLIDQMQSRRTRGGPD